MQRDLCPHFDASFLQNAGEEKSEEYIAKKTNILVICNDTDCILTVSQYGYLTCKL